MRILAIAPQPFFASRGTPLSVYYRTLVMAEQGAEIDLLTYGSGHDVDIAGLRQHRIPRIRALEPIPIGPSWQKALLDVLMIVWTLGLLLRHRYRVVCAHEEAVFWCQLLKPLFGFRLVYDMHSSLPQQLDNTSFTQRPWLIGWFRRLELASLRRADVVVTVCPDLQVYAQGAGAAGRELLIENSLFEEVRLAPQEAAKTHSSGPAVEFSRDAAIVLYAGTFEVYQGLDLLVEAFGKVVERVPHARLLLVGGFDQQVRQLRDLMDKLGIGAYCQLTGHVPKAAVHHYIERSHALVSPRIKGTNTPLKIYELLASGRPMVATRIWSHTQVLNDSVCRLVDANAEDMADGLVEVLTEPARSAQWVERAGQLYESRYSRGVYEDKVKRLFELITGKVAPSKADRSTAST